MSNETVLWLASADRGKKTLLDGTFRPLASPERRLYARELIDLSLQFYSGRNVAALPTGAGYKVAAKDPDDLDGDLLFQSTNVTSSAADLAAGLLTFGDVDLNTVELIAWIGTEPTLDARLEVLQLDAPGGVEEQVLLQTDVPILHDVIQGDEDAPVYAPRLKHNVSASAAPTADDDSSDGYGVGSVWIYDGAVYICTDATEGAAVWYTWTPATSHTHQREHFTLNATDITNAYVLLGMVPATLTMVRLAVVGPGWQQYGLDYTAEAAKKVTWGGLGLDGILEAGDKLIIEYYT